MDHLAELLCSSADAAARQACCAPPRCRRATREALSLAKALAARGHEYERTLDVRAGASLMRTPTRGRMPHPGARAAAAAPARNGEATSLGVGGLHLTFDF